VGEAEVEQEAKNRKNLGNKKRSYRQTGGMYWSTSYGERDIKHNRYRADNTKVGRARKMEAQSSETMRRFDAARWADE
jgi:hypothetical protein